MLVIIKTNNSYVHKSDCGKKVHFKNRNDKHSEIVLEHEDKNIIEEVE